MFAGRLRNVGRMLDEAETLAEDDDLQGSRKKYIQVQRELKSYLEYVKASQRDIERAMRE